MVSVGGSEVHPNATETQQSGTASTSCEVGSTTASLRCPQFQSCYKGTECKTASDAAIWTAPGDPDARSTKLAACNRETYITSYWELKQAECPSWTTVDVPLRSYWGSNDEGQYLDWVNASNPTDTKFSGSWSSSGTKTRRHCGTKSASPANDLCKTQCSTKQSSYNSGDTGSFWDSWNTIYQECKTENFLTTDWWSTHDVCHLTVFDHDGTAAQIIDPRKKSGNSSESTWVTECYGTSCTEGTNDENPLKSETWGKWAFDFCDSGSLDTQLTGTSSSNIYLGRKYLHSDGWDNQAETTTTPSYIFPYALKGSSIESLTTWPEWRAANSGTVALCSVEATDESVTPADVTHNDTLDQIGKVHCWKQRAESLIVDDEFGPTNCQ